MPSKKTPNRLFFLWLMGNRLDGVGAQGSSVHVKPVLISVELRPAVNKGSRGLCWSGDQVLVISSSLDTSNI